jgi:cAMP-dependent protein kinase regulator
LKESFLFRSLEERETDIVIGAMEERRFAAGDKVIAQGEDGDVLYVVDAGELDCYKKFGVEEKHLKVYKPGEAFGELALLYNAPRAATIISKSESTLFALDRQTFNNIVKDAAQKKRKIYEEVLCKVEILKETDPYERNQVADVLKDLNVAANDYVIR